jgi:hypothetical protein
MLVAITKEDVFREKLRVFDRTSINMCKVRLCFKSNTPNPSLLLLVMFPKIAMAYYVI